MAKAQGKLMLDALVAAIAEILGIPHPTPPTSDERRTLWSHGVDDRYVPVDPDSDGEKLPYTVFRIWGGDPASTKQNRINVQAMTTGRDAASAFTQSEQVHNAMLYGDEEPWPGEVRRDWAINGFLVSIFELTQPANIGGDEHGVDVVFNFAVGYAPDA